MARPPIQTERAHDAAALLRRLGFAILLAVVPVAGFLFRRGVVVLLPVGIALLVIAAALDGGFRRPRVNIENLSASTGVAATLLAIGWACLSLGWTPSPGVAGERLFAALASPALGLAAHFALPERTRSANLYLAPIGTALAAAAALALAFKGSGWAALGDEDGPNLERGLAALALGIWPSIAWLRSRGRDLEAMSLAIIVAVAVGIVPQGATSVALAAGAAAFVLVALGGRPVALALGGVLAATLMVIPIAAILLQPGLPGIGSFGAIIAADPARLVTGHGFGELLRARLAGSIAPTVPDSAPVQVWYDLGLVGALAVATALAACLSGAAHSYGPLLPGIAGAAAAGFALAFAGIGNGQAWWPAALTVVVLTFVAAERGQFRTRRPRAGALAPA